MILVFFRLISNDIRRLLNNEVIQNIKANTGDNSILVDAFASDDKSTQANEDKENNNENDSKTDLLKNQESFYSEALINNEDLGEIAVPKKSRKKSKCLMINLESLNLDTVKKRYKHLNKTLKKIDNVESIRVFIKNEKNLRKNKEKNRISKPLKKDDWTEFLSFLRESINSLKKIEDNAILMNELKKIKLKIKYWVLFPDFKGKKPKNWSEFVKLIKN